MLVDEYRDIYEPRRPFTVTRKGQKASQLQRLQQGATLLGITLESYIQHLEDGQLHCGYHRAWEPAEMFGKNQGYCRAGTNAKNREAKQARLQRAAAEGK